MLSCRSHAPRLVAIAVAVWCSAAQAEEATYSWKTGAAQSEVRVSISAVRRHAYDAVKVTTNVPASTARVLAILKAFETYTQWYHRAAEVRVLQRPAAPTGEVAWTLFFRQHAPPLDDRWTILRARLRTEPKGSHFIEFHTIQHPFTPPEHTVHMDLRGYWKLRPLGPGRSEVTLMIDVDPNTAVPAFLVDPQLHEAATHTLAALRARALRRER